MTNSSARVLTWIFTVAFIYALSAMVISREVIVPHEFPSAVSGNIPGDPDYYHRLALDRAQEIRAGGPGRFELRPEGQGVAGVASLAYLVNPTPYGMVLLNAVLHGISALLMAMILMYWFAPGVALIALVPLVVSPYMMVWFSQLNKDSFVLTGVMAIVLGLVMFAKEKSGTLLKEGIFPLLLMIGGVTFVWIMRPYLNQVMLPVVSLAMATTVVSRFRTHPEPAGRRAAFATCSVVAVLFMALLGQGSASGKTLQSFEQFDFKGGVGTTTRAAHCLDRVERGVWRDEAYLPGVVNRKLRAMMGQRCLTLSLLDTQGNPTVLRSFVDEEIWPGGTMEALRYLPRAVLLGVFSPWPDYWDFDFTNGPSFFYTIVPLEAMLLYVGLIGMGLWWWRVRETVVLAPLGIFLCVSAAYGMTTPFVGVLYRYRYPFWMVMICLGLAALMELLSRRAIRTPAEAGR